MCIVLCWLLRTFFVLLFCTYFQPYLYFNITNIVKSVSRRDHASRKIYYNYKLIFNGVEVGSRRWIKHKVIRIKGNSRPCGSGGSGIANRRTLCTDPRSEW